MIPKYAIGQEVWLATFDSEETSIECPDCGGTGRLRVTFHDETTVSIECRNCACGYDPPTGRVRCYDRKPKAPLVTISGVEISDRGVEYRSRHYILEEGRMFLTEDEALRAAERLAADEDRGERERILRKEKDTRTWAWNASYHRNEIKRAKQSIAYHESKLAVASVKAKEDRAKVTAPSEAREQEREA